MSGQTMANWWLDSGQLVEISGQVVVDMCLFELIDHYVPLTGH